jgi:hypothetical protein
VCMYDIYIVVVMGIDVVHQKHLESKSSYHLGWREIFVILSFFLLPPPFLFVPAGEVRLKPVQPSQRILLAYSRIRET